MKLFIPSKEEASELLTAQSQFRGLSVCEGALPPTFLFENAKGTAASDWIMPRLLVDEVTGRVVGNGGFKYAPREGKVEIGYGVAAACQRQGFATQGAKLLCEEAFSSGLVNEILAETSFNNTASERVLKKVGFIHCGYGKDHEGPVRVWSRKKESAMKLSRVEQAARNNAIWCDTVCRAHGLSGEFLDAVWVYRHPAPAYYPNVVTLRQAGEETAVLATVRDLIARELPSQWAVKDSYRTLDLSKLGFGLLFEASWIWHEALSSPTAAQDSEIRWAPVMSAVELANWEAAWSTADGNTETSHKPRMFPPSLLADRNVAFLAGYRGQQLVAGGIANASETVVGLSNVFAPKSHEPSVWAGLLTSVQTVFPKLHVVGYEHGLALQAALEAGFEEIGALRVWLRHT